MIKKNKKGFIFIETIVVIAILLASLILVYSAFVSSYNQENRRLRYDDISKLYETYYLAEYLQSFELDTLKQGISTNGYVNIYPGQSDLFGASYNGEKIFFERLWSNLHIQTAVLTPYDVSDLTDCSSPSNRALCTHTNLITYMRTLNNDETKTGYRLIVEFAHKLSGEPCTGKANCFYYYANVEVGA